MHARYACARKWPARMCAAARACARSRSRRRPRSFCCAAGRFALPRSSALYVAAMPYSSPCERWLVAFRLETGPSHAAVSSSSRRADSAAFRAVFSVSSSSSDSLKDPYDDNSYNRNTDDAHASANANDSANANANASHAHSYADFRPHAHLPSHDASCATCRLMNDEFEEHDAWVRSLKESAEVRSAVAPPAARA
eukprot:394427-Pleurochrysis_carterae.AAC.1